MPADSSTPSSVKPAETNTTPRLPVDLLAIDMDGTMLDDEGKLPAANAAAIRRAVDAGLQVVLCTGRGHIEAKHVLDDLPLPGPHVFNTGAMLVEHRTGQTLAASCMPTDLVKALVDTLWDEPDAILLYRDQTACGHDYLVTGQGQMAANSRWWFGQVGVKLLETQNFEPAHAEHTVRVGMVGEREAMQAHVKKLSRAFPGRLACHAFEAVLEKSTDKVLSILEVFDAHVNKWHGIQAACQTLGLSPHRVAFIGDQINDLSALTHASIGYAVGNAVPSAKAAADIVLQETNNQHAVAVAIDQLLQNNVPSFA